MVYAFARAKVGGLLVFELGHIGKLPARTGISCGNFPLTFSKGPHIHDEELSRTVDTVYLCILTEGEAHNCRVSELSHL